MHRPTGLAKRITKGNAMPEPQVPAYLATIKPTEAFMKNPSVAQAQAMATGCKSGRAESASKKSNMEYPEGSYRMSHQGLAYSRGTPKLEIQNARVDRVTPHWLGLLDGSASEGYSRGQRHPVEGLANAQQKKMTSKSRCKIS